MKLRGFGSRILSLFLKYVYGLESWSDYPWPRLSSSMFKQLLDWPGFWETLCGWGGGLGRPGFPAQKVNDDAKKPLSGSLILSSWFNYLTLGIDSDIFSYMPSMGTSCIRTQPLRPLLARPPDSPPLSLSSWLKATPHPLPRLAGGECRHPYHAQPMHLSRTDHAYITGTHSHMMCPYISPFFTRAKEEDDSSKHQFQLDKTTPLIF